VNLPLIQLQLSRISGGNLNTRAALLEVVNDALGSAAVLVAAGIIAFTGWARADALASILIGVMILPRTWKLLRETVDVLRSKPRCRHRHHRAGPESLEYEAAQDFYVTITMGCGDACPVFLGNATRTGSSTTRPGKASSSSAYSGMHPRPHRDVGFKAPPGYPPVPRTRESTGRWASFLPVRLERPQEIGTASAPGERPRRRIPVGLADQCKGSRRPAKASWDGSSSFGGVSVTLDGDIGLGRDSRPLRRGQNDGYRSRSRISR
jgi:hypothetical protein